MMETNKERDEELFAQLKKAKRKKRRKVILTVLILLALAGVGIFAGMNYLRGRVQAQLATNTVEVKSYQAESGRINTTVSGSGTLSYTGHEDLNLPEGVEVDELLVAVGDPVTADMPLMTVDINTVMTALADTQTELEDLDKQINNAKSDKVSTALTTTVAGRVKRIYAADGENVVDVMTEHGALAILSLDGCMTVAIDADLQAGETVTVQTGDKTYPGKVESCISGRSIIALTDNGPAYEAEAAVQDGDGNTLGTGTLEIRNPLSITGYAGTVGRVNVKENQQIYAGGSIFTLKNTSYTANYDTLLRSRAEKEKKLNTLITLLRTGSLNAPFDGIVTDMLDEGTTDAVSAYLGTASSGALITIAPDKQVCVSVSVDETDILSLEMGQSAEVTISSIGEDVYPATVTEISRLGSSLSGVTQYSAVVTLDKTPRMLSGMSASVDIQIRGVDDVVLIPVDALHQTRNTSYVYTEYNEELKEYGGMVEVTAGASNSSFVEIISGLNPGDTVYYTEKAATINLFSMMPGMNGNWNNRGGNNRSGSNAGSNRNGNNGNLRIPGMGG